MFPEARIDVTLTTLGGCVAEVRVQSSRLLQATSLFAGRRPTEVAHLLPTVFSLCGAAQRIACVTAVEAAAGHPPAPEALAARRAALLAETVSEHGLSMARDWPELIDEAADLATAKTLRMAMLAGRKPEVSTAHAAFAGLLGGDPDDILGDLDSFQHWIAIRSTAAARLFADLLMERLAGFGGVAFNPMPQGGPADLAARLADDDGSYVARPDGGFETGPLARHRGHPLLAELLLVHGNGLLPRLAARLIEVAQALRELDRLVQNPADEPALATASDGHGMGVLEAARGMLAHRVELRDGRVKRYQILAPTEWNFHPQGPLVRGLTGALADGDLARRARLLVHALDPCVTCSVTVE